MKAGAEENLNVLLMLYHIHTYTAYTQFCTRTHTRQRKGAVGNAECDWLGPAGLALQVYVLVKCTNGPLRHLWGVVTGDS